MLVLLLMLTATPIALAVASTWATARTATWPELPIRLRLAATVAELPTTTQLNAMDAATPVPEEPWPDSAAAGRAGVGGLGARTRAGSPVLPLVALGVLDLAVGLAVGVAAGRVVALGAGVGVGGRRDGRGGFDQDRGAGQAASGGRGRGRQQHVDRDRGADRHVRAGRLGVGLGGQGGGVGRGDRDRAGRGGAGRPGCPGRRWWWCRAGSPARRWGRPRPCPWRRRRPWW